MMDIFDTSYDAEIKELLFPEYSMNKLIDGQIVYVIDEDY